MALILDGTDGITSSGGTNVLQDDAVITANIADGAVSDAKIAAMAAAKLTGTIASARLPAGSVLQVVSTTKTDTFSASVAVGVSVDVTGLSASITPSSASSKILVMSSLSCHNGVEGGAGLVIFRNGTLILPSVSKGSQTEGRLNASMIGLETGEIQGNVNFSGLDSPNSTSAQTYQVRIYNVASTTRTVHVNRPSNESSRYFSVSTITLMEIAA